MRCDCDLSCVDGLHTLLSVELRCERSRVWLVAGVSRVLLDSEIERALIETEGDDLCARCWDCDQLPSVEPDLAGYGYIVACDNCYDGAPDSTSRGDYGFGTNETAAVRAWNERAMEAL